MAQKIGIIALMLALGLGGCGERRADKPGVQKVGKSYFGAFDTLTVITGYARSEASFERASDGAFDLLIRYHRAWRRLEARRASKSPGTPGDWGCLKMAK